MKQSPTRVVLIILFVFLGCFGVAYAAAGMLTALPAPAIGGTCGPSTGSETALEALARPGSIGAGPEPPASNVTAHHQWSTFIQQCQDLADHRGLASAAIFVISIVVAGVGLFWVLRKREDGVTEGSDVGTDPGQPSYTPLGLHDPATLVGAGAVVGGAAPVATWPPAPQPGYGPPPGYPMQPSYYPGAYPESGYPPQAWPAQPEGYPPPPPYLPPPGYSQAPGYAPQAYPPQQPPPSAYPVPPPPPTTSAPEALTEPEPAEPAANGDVREPDREA